ncbi:hypothetical protein GCM10027423_57100 [Spirosoma arcticum]
MRFLVLLTILTFASVTAWAQTVLYNGPDSVLPNSDDNYSTINLPAGVTVNWSISGTGGVIRGVTTNPLVFYNVTTAPVILLARLSNGTSLADTIPVVQAGPVLTEGTVAMTAGIRRHPILQLLRGERAKIKPINFTGAKPVLTLLSSQGRVLTTGDSIDFRSPTRGLYFIVAKAPSAGQLKVEGISPNTPPVGGGTGASPLTQPACMVGKLDAQLDRKSNFTGGESMVTIGSKVITAVYDFVQQKTIINAYQNDRLLWTWLSNENEYLRTLNTHPTFGIVGIGSSGGALKSEDNVLVLKLNGDGVLQMRTTFGTADGKDFGFGVSFLNDGTLMATGFTEGNFPAFKNAGGLDAFAVRISATGTVLNTLQFGSAANDRIFASQTAKNGNILLFGDTEGQIGDAGTPLGAYDLFIIELTPTGTRLRNTQYASAENDLAFDLVVDPVSGDMFVTGMTTGELVSGFGNPQMPQVFTARIDNNTHKIVWLNQLGLSEGQSGESIALSGTGVGVIFYTFGSFAGASNNSLGTPASDDMVVALFDINGNLNALYQFDQTLERIFARAIAFDGNTIFVLRDHVYEPGRPYITTSLDRFAKPAVVTGVEEPISPPGNGLIYPNPATSVINVTCDKGYRMFNVSGFLVKESDHPTTTISIADLPTGLYIIRSDNRAGRFLKY